MFRKFLFLTQILKYLTLIKIFNFIIGYKSYLFSRKKILFGNLFIPWFISVEPSNFCQLECPECPVGINQRKKGTLFEETLFHKTIDDIKNKVIHIIFYFQGEPLLNRKLPAMIKYAHDAGIFTSTSTNGQALNSERAKELVLSGLDKLIFSIDGTTQEVYEKYRKGGSLERVKNAVLHINHWKKELKSTTPFVEIQFIVFGTNQHQMNEMKQLAKTLNADRLAFKSAQIYDFENGSELITSISKYSRYKKTESGKYEIKNKLHNHCQRLWSGAVINVNGDILPCCFDKNADHSFGNLNEKSFKSIINGENSTSFRHSILTNRKQHEICRNCTEK